MQSGDVFDRPRSWELLPQVISLLKKYPDVKIYGVYGGKNHDTYLHSNETRHKTNLGILERSGLIEILNDKGLSIGGIIEPNKYRVLIYGVSYGEEIPKVEKFYKNQINILVIHAPITIDINNSFFECVDAV